jgi:hypothetical protein
MTIIFSDEYLIIIDKKHDNQLGYIRPEIDTLKAKGSASFCKKCSHIMQDFTVGTAKLLQFFFSAVSVGIE